MSTTVAESPLRSKIKERRLIQDVVRNLLDSSQRVETPAGLVTLVDLKFLRELADVQVVTGEQLFAVVDADYLELCGIVVGVTEPTVHSVPESLSDQPLTKTEIRDLQHFFGWSNKEFAMEMGVSVQRVSDWQIGVNIPYRDRAARLYELFDHMAAEKARESGVQS